MTYVPSVRLCRHHGGSERRPARTARALTVAIATTAVLMAAACGGSSPSGATADDSAPGGATANGATADDSAPGGAASASAASRGESLDTSLNPCSLLTADQVATATGMEVSAGKATKDKLSDSRNCTWSSKRFQANPAELDCARDVTDVVLEVAAPPPALKRQYPTARSYYDFTLKTYRQRSGSVEQLSGIGDAAFAWTIKTRKGLDEYATKGNALLRAFSNCGKSAMLQPQLAELLKQALART